MSLSTWVMVAGSPGVGSTTGMRPFSTAIRAAIRLSLRNRYSVGSGCVRRIL